MSSPAETVTAAASRNMSFVDATVEALREEMRRDPTIFYMGEGIGARGGNFRQTKGLHDEFGPQRVRDTPISELGFTGAGVGAAMAGMRPVVDLMFADFLGESMSQIVHQAAKVHYLSNGRFDVPMVIRIAFGEVRSAGAHHSGCYYPWFMHQPGLKVVVPSNASDAKGLWKTALRERCPVLIFEHKRLYTQKGPVPTEEYLLPFGKAALVRAGSDVTITATANMVPKSVAAAAVLEKEGISVEILDLRTLVPLDKEAILASVAKTGRLVVADEAFATCGLSAEIAAIAVEEAFGSLRAPVQRISMTPAPHPFSPALESAVVPGPENIAAAVRAAVTYSK
jgi:pyruvate/2-oxoglutarate/acetoin dehydrogenase E1 component